MEKNQIRVLLHTKIFTEFASLCWMLIWLISPTFAFAGISKTICKSPEFKCYKVKSRDSWRSLFPDEQEREVVMRINRLNTQIWAGMTIAIPQSLEDVDIFRYSPFPLEITPTNERIIVVDPNAQAFGAYDENGSLVRWGPASSGADWCKDIEASCQTHPGSFRIYSLGNSDCYSTKFPLPDGGAPMPYCMYFNGGQALHGEPNGLPGYNASHGCVRLYVNDAEWLRYDFVEGPNANNNYRGTRVDVLPYGDTSNTVISQGRNPQEHLEVEDF